MQVYWTQTPAAEKREPPLIDDLVERAKKPD